MKKQPLFILLLVASTFATHAQTFIPAAHKVLVNISGNSGHGITSLRGTRSSVVLRYTAVASDFPADWLKVPDFGFCDPRICTENIEDTFLWDKAKNKGNPLFCPYPDTSDMFELVLDNMIGKTIGCFYMSVQFKDTAVGGTVDTITFNVCNSPLNLPSTVLAADIVVFPNPANEVLYLAYGSDVKKAGICDLAGRMVKTCNVAGSGSSIIINDLVQGMYFVKLYDGNDHIVATRKFLKQ